MRALAALTVISIASAIILSLWYLPIGVVVMLTVAYMIGGALFVAWSRRRHGEADDTPQVFHPFPLHSWAKRRPPDR